MISRLESMCAKRARGEAGFTLIELLVVVVIIGILVAIAIPLYLNYRQGAANKSLESDVRAAVSTVEQCIGENNNVPPAAATSGSGATATGTDVVFSCGGTTANNVTTGATTETAKVGNGNQLTYTFVAGATGTAGSYTIIGKNSNETVTYTSATSSTTKASGGLTA